MTNNSPVPAIYMQRCLDLAKQGLGYVAPNPMVGAVLVYEDRIIGEGYHQKYGEAHAEVNCIRQAIQNGHTDKLQLSTMYVSLEPCVHFGKTPPCTDLIIKHKIPNVVIGCRDPFEEVNGKGIEKLKAAEVDVVTGVLEEECKELNKRFFTFHQQHRPYVILKWAETADGFIGTSPQTPLQGRGAFEDPGNKRLLISNDYTNKLVHKWRSEEAGILIGTNTALLDDPELTVRHWTGSSPVRLVMDMNLRLPVSLKIFDRQVRTIIFNTVKQEIAGNLEYRKILKNKPIVQQVLDTLYQLSIQSVMAEGGAKLLQSLIDEGMWDEARVIRNAELKIGSGLAAPLLKDAAKVSEQKIVEDRIEIYKHVN
jgi:diaminohydroxyphosphoribosylaminopyrimidine deaminase / 5-amino-6-(5-phosphoribosylamino)uracil reductase